VNAGGWRRERFLPIRETTRVVPRRGARFIGRLERGEWRGRKDFTNKKQGENKMGNINIGPIKKEGGFILETWEPNVPPK